MSGASRNAGASTSTQTGTGEKSFFEQQRELLLKEIGVVGGFLGVVDAGLMIIGN